MKTQFITKDHKLYSSKILCCSLGLFRTRDLLSLDEPKSIFSRLIHGFRRREQTQSPPFVFNAQLLSSPTSNPHFQANAAAAAAVAPRVMTDYGMIEPHTQFRASSRSHPHTMRRASLRTHSTDTRQSAQQILPPSSVSSTQMRRPRPRSFSFDEQLSIIDDDDESIAHDMPFSVAPGRPFHAPPLQQQQQQQQQNQVQHRRLNTSKVSSRCRNRRRRSRSLTKRTNHRPNNPPQHEWLHTTENHHDSTSSEEIDEEDDDDDDVDENDENQAHFSPRSTSTAANRPRNRKPILHASDFDRRLCEATTNTGTTVLPNEQENPSPINVEIIQHHTSPVSQPSTEPDDINLIVYSANSNDLLNATIISRKSETKKLSSHEKLLAIRYGSPDSGISGKT